MGSWPTPKPAVKTAITVLAAAFPGIRVSVKMPRERPVRFVRVSRIGGTMPNPVTDSARILVECWGPGSDTVEDMTATARKALRDSAGTIVGGVFVRCWGNEQGPVDFPDPDVTDMERWQFFGDFDVSTS